MYHRFKKEETKSKFWLVDYSFYIYNGTYANKRDCICTCGGTKIAKCDCEICGGTGKDFLRNKDSFVTGGLYHVFKHILDKMDQGYKIIQVFDPPKAQLDRSNLIDGYKANRGEKPEFITAQMKLGPELFSLTKNIQCFSSKKDESDDVLATIAIELAEEGHEVVVATDDKDAFPLLAWDNIELFRQKEMFNSNSYKKYVKKKWNVDIGGPERFSEFLAIIGDIADNYNLIKGLGPKAAEYFINKYNPIDKLWDDWDNVPDKYKKKLVADCIGDTCSKCKTCDSFADFLMPQYPTTQLRNVLDTSLKLAYLNKSADYYRIENKDDFQGFYNKLTELELKAPLYHINKFFC